MSVDLSQILSKPVESFEPPKRLPPGMYLFRVAEAGPGRVSQSGNPSIAFTCDAIQPLDVEQESLAGIEFPKRMTLTFYMTEASSFRVRQFLENTLGITISNMTLGEAIRESVSRVFRGTVTHRPAQNDPTNFFAEISETFPAE